MAEHAGGGRGGGFGQFYRRSPLVAQSVSEIIGSDNNPFDKVEQGTGSGFTSFEDFLRAFEVAARARQGERAE